MLWKFSLQKNKIRREASSHIDKHVLRYSLRYKTENCKKYIEFLIHKSWQHWRTSSETWKPFSPQYISSLVLFFMMIEVYIEAFLQMIYQKWKERLVAVAKKLGKFGEKPIFRFSTGKFATLHTLLTSTMAAKSERLFGTVCQPIWFHKSLIW